MGENLENTFESSQDLSGQTFSSQFSSQFSDRSSLKALKTTKDEWLRDHYALMTRKDGVKVLVCYGCDKEFANRGHMRMKSHLLRCPKTSLSDQKRVAIMDRKQTTNSITTTQLVRALIDAGWSLNGLESKEVKKFISRLTDSWTVPRRQDVSTIHIPEISEKFHNKFISSINSGSTTQISIEFDHWKDANGRSFLGVLATCKSGKRHLLDLRDVSLEGHYADVTVEELVEALKDVPKDAINSFVSDAASTCKKARDDLVALPEFKHVIHHRCIAHLMNLVGSRITAKDQILETVTIAGKITKLIRHSTHWGAYIKNLEMKKPQLACPVRWYSMVAMLIGLQDLKGVIVETILPTLKSDKAALVQSLNWTHLDEIVGVLEPLTTCIGHIERHDTTIGEAVKNILEYAKKLFCDDSNCNRGGIEQTPGTFDAKVIARRAFLHHFNESKLENELGLYIAAYVLDRRFRIDYVTAEGLKLGLKSMASVAVKTGVTLDDVKRSMFYEFQCYQDFKHHFSMTDQRPTEWWKARKDRGSILSSVGYRLANLNASSANMERTFSSIKYIQGDYRLNLSHSTLLHSARIKISLKEDKSTTNKSDNYDWSELINLIDGDDASLDNAPQLHEESATLTLQSDCTNWIEDEAIIIKKNYQSFFKYFDFGIMNKQKEDQHAFCEVTEEQINDCVESQFQQGFQETVIVEEFAQFSVFDDTMDL